MGYGASIFTFLRESGRLRISDSFRGGLSIIGILLFDVVDVVMMEIVLHCLAFLLNQSFLEIIIVFAMVCYSD